MSSTRAKIINLEQRLMHHDCQTCYGWPSRTVCIDAETGQETGASMPPDGCPECGRPIRMTYELIGMTMEELP